MGNIFCKNSRNFLCLFFTPLLLKQAGFLGQKSAFGHGNPFSKTVSRMFWGLECPPPLLYDCCIRPCTNVPVQYIGQP